MHRAHTTPQQREFLEDAVQRQTIPEYTPPSPFLYQTKLKKAKTKAEKMAVVTDWAMKTGLCNEIDKEAYEDLIMLRSGVS